MSENCNHMPTHLESTHLGSKFTWSHVFSTILLVGAMIGVYTDNISQHSAADKRISIMEVQMSAEHEANIAFRDQFGDQLKAMDKKLDRIIERGINNHKSGGNL